MSRVKTLLGSTTQFSLVTDASTHSCKEVIVSLCHADDCSIVVPITIRGQGNITVNDADLPSLSHLRDLAAKQKLERESAYHFIKAISHELDVLTGGRVNIETFKVDSDKRRPVKPGERRVRTTRPGMLHVGGLSDNNAEGLSDNNAEGLNENDLYVTEHVAYIQNVDDGSSVPVLPTDPSWQIQQPMLTLSIDQGGVGMAAAAFLIKDHMLHIRCDKIHRVIRDYKLAISHAADGLFLKAQLHSGYIFPSITSLSTRATFLNKRRTWSKHFLQQSNLFEVWIFVLKCFVA